MKMHTLWLTSPALEGVTEVPGEAPRFDKLTRIDGPQALERLRDPQAMENTTWLWQLDPLGPTPDDLRQALQGERPKLWVLALLPAEHLTEAAAWLDAGVDRCLPWPCPPALLAAMLRALRRRAEPSQSRVSQWGALRFDHDAMTLFCEDQRIALTQREAEVMALLIRRVGQWVTNQEISTHMSHGLPGVLRPGAVQLYVHRINRKIAPHGWHVDCVKRVGYGLKVLPASAPAGLPAAAELPAALAHRPFASAWVPSDSGGVSP